MANEQFEFHQPNQIPDFADFSVAAEEAEALRLYRVRKQTVNFMAGGLILYAAISTLIVYLDLLLPDTDYENYTSSIIGVLLGFVCLYLLTRKQLPLKAYFTKKKPMTPLLFLLFTCVMCSGQLLFTFFDTGLESLLNLFGLSAVSSVESATAGAITVSSFIYGTVIAPVFEELVYRGFVLRMSENLGKKYAVVLSAVLFGVMHANIPQGFFAFYIGLVFGYVAVNYSLPWSIALHFVNNAIVGELLSFLMQDVSDEGQDLIFYLLMGTCTLVTFIALIVYRDKLRAFIRNHPTVKGAWRITFTAVLMILFLLMHIVPAFLSLDLL